MLIRYRSHFFAVYIMAIFVLFFTASVAKIADNVMRLLITGANGLLGQKLVALIAPRTDVELIATLAGQK